MGDVGVGQGMEVGEAIEWRSVWRDDELVERLAERAALGLHHADDHIREALHKQLTPDGLQASEVVRRDVLSDDDGIAAVRVLLLAE